MKTWPARAWEFCWAPLVDRYQGPSITRVLAAFFAAMCWRSLELGRSIGLNVLWLALACIAAAFGKSTFTFLLERMRYRGAAEQQDVRVDVAVRQVQERRRGAEFEATP